MSDLHGMNGTSDTGDSGVNDYANEVLRQLCEHLSKAEASAEKYLEIVEVSEEYTGAEGACQYASEALRRLRGEIESLVV